MPFTYLGKKTLKAAITEGPDINLDTTPIYDDAVKRNT